MRPLERRDHRTGQDQPGADGLVGAGLHPSPRRSLLPGTEPVLKDGTMHQVAMYAREDPTTGAQVSTSVWQAGLALVDLVEDR